MDRARAILLVEDNPGDARLISELISTIGYRDTLDVRDTLSSALEALSVREYDVVLLDLGLPESVGLGTYTRIRDRAPDVATIVLTGNTDAQLAVRAVAEGAQDFLVKGRVDGELLERAIGYALSRKQAQREILRQTRLLGEAERIAHLASWQLDVQGGEGWCSAEVHEILGVESVTAPSLRAVLADMVHPDDREYVESMLLEEVAAEIPPMEFRIVRPDGAVRWLHRRARWERDAAGCAVSAVGILQDVTDRVLAQESIASSEEFNRALIDGLDQHAILMLDDAGHFSGWNAGAERLFGCTLEDIRELALPDLAVDRSGRLDLAAAVETATLESRATVACLLRRGANGEFWGSAHLSRIGDGSTSRGIALIVHDTSEKKSAADHDAVRVAVSETLSSTDSLEEAWPLVLRDTCFGMGFEIGEAWEFDEESGELHFAALWSADAEHTRGLVSCDSRYRFQPSDTGPLHVMRVGLSKTGCDLADVAHGPRLFELRRLGMECVAVVPVTDGNRAFGVMLLFSRTAHGSAAAGSRILDEVGNRIAQYAAKERLKQQVISVGLFDPLTGLPNRTYFMERLSMALTRRPLRGDPAALVVLAQVDQIDRVSDTYGHQVADRVILSVAERISATLGTDDTVARLWGGVLAILVHDVHAPVHEAEVLDRISASLEAPIEMEGATVFATVSTGSTRGGPTDGPEDVLRCATIALHRARLLGMNGRVLFDQGMRDFADLSVSTEGELRRAIEHGQLAVFYQPIIAVSSGRIVGAEGLIRWHHPARGLVMPGEFISTAEETGLIGAIGDLVLRAACEECSRWTSIASWPVGISVNLSASQFRSADLAAGVLSALQETQLLPGLLTVEITESVLMSDAEKASRVLDRLREVGVGVSVDDFGTGYSSLSYLKRLPIDKLKIDRSFVNGIPGDSDNVAIVVAVLNMAHALGLEVVAEGVELGEQLDFLRRYSCDLAQGFLFSKAVPAEEFRAMLAAGKHATTIA